MTTNQALKPLEDIRTIIEFFSELEYQDVSLTNELAIRLLNDVLATGHIGNIEDYVQRYCDVIDTADQKTMIVDEIRRNLA